MLSRVAESIYWLNRYIERAENIARFIDVNLHLTVGKNDKLAEQWRPLISTIGDEDEFDERYDGIASRENVLTFLLFDANYSNSVVSCVKRARENARRIRQALPLVVWEQLNLFYLMVCNAAEEKDFSRIQDFCEQVRLTSHLLGGAEDATSTKGEAWNFGRLARMTERADKTSRIVDVQYYLLLPDQEGVGSALDVLRWSALLQSTSALMMYRRQYGRIVPSQVADFLILDPYFSRSMYHCVLSAKEALAHVLGDETKQSKTALPTRIGKSIDDNLAIQQLSQLEHSMSDTNIESVIATGIHEYIDDFQEQLNSIGNLLQANFFSWSGDDTEEQLAMAQQQS